MHVPRDNARLNMVMQQLRPNQVSDPAVLKALATIDRADFVDKQFQGLAYADTELPIGCDQSLLSPLLEGRLLQELALRPDETVLEIGTGSGYFTALLAQLAGQVISLELFEPLHQLAQQRLQALDIHNVELRCADGSRGLVFEDRLDAIVATAAFVTVPDAYLHSLKIGGRMLVAVGQPPLMQLQRIQRVNEWQWQTVNLFETVMPMLLNAEPRPEFVF